MESGGRVMMSSEQETQDVSDGQVFVGVETVAEFLVGVFPCERQRVGREDCEALQGGRGSGIRRVETSGISVSGEIRKETTGFPS